MKFITFCCGGSAPALPQSALDNSKKENNSLQDIPASFRWINEIKMYHHPPEFAI
jgi:hypothetical protein